MSKFTLKKVSSKTLNLAGGQAYKQSTPLAFLSLLFASFLGDQFYRSGNDSQKELIALFHDLKDKKFAAKAALYARNTLGMRSVSHVIAGEIANSVKGEEWTKSFFEKIVRRPDDMMEILSYYQSNFGNKEPNALKKGFAKALEKMSPVWYDLLSEKKLGYFALLRNLRNILVQAPKAVDLACEALVNSKDIQESLILPFRFITAYQQLQTLPGASKMLTALSVALEISFLNVPKFEGKTLVVVDHSGSMGNDMDSPFMKGALFGIALAKSNGADFMHFGDIAKYVPFNSLDTTLTLANWLNEQNSGRLRVGNGTNFHSIFQAIDKKYDRIVIFSDMQGWMGYYTPTTTFEEYKAKYNCKPFIYSFDLTGYGDMQLPENRVFCLAGWSEKIFDLMKYMETDGETLQKFVESIEL